MTLLWVNPATSNRFANKHLHIIPGAPTLQNMVDEGYRVFDARVEAYRLRSNRSARARGLKATYGKTDISNNTLVVLSNAGLQSLAAAIAGNGHRSGWYTTRNGVIFTMDDQAYSVNLVADLDLHVRPCTGGHEVHHLNGARVQCRLRPSTAEAKSQTKLREVQGSQGTLGLHFTPSTSELVLAQASLKKVGAPVVMGVPTWALGDVTGVDLSFLDD
jgi:hypothetical protein